MKRLFNKILSYFPTPIPTGMTAFSAWLESIVSLAGPIADPESIKWVVCNEIMRLSPGRDRVSKNSIVKLLRKFAANQLAASVVVEIRTMQEKKLEEAKKQQEAEEAKQTAEATAQPQVAPDEKT